MGSLISTINRLLGSEKVIRIVIVGLDGAGKTTLLYKLKLGEAVQTVPTIGFNMETIKYKNITLTVWDVGGQYKIRALWRYYYTGADAVIFVVDSNDVSGARFEEVKEEVGYLLREDELKNAVVLIFANKQDIPGALSPEKISYAIFNTTQTDGAGGSRNCCRVQGISARTGDGIQEGLDWLVRAIPEKHKQAKKAASAKQAEAAVDSVNAMSRSFGGAAPPAAFASDAQKLSAEPKKKGNGTTAQPSKSVTIVAETANSKTASKQTNNSSGMSSFLSTYLTSWGGAFAKGSGSSPKGSPRRGRGNDRLDTQTASGSRAGTRQALSLNGGKDKNRAASVPPALVEERNGEKGEGGTAQSAPASWQGSSSSSKGGQQASAAPPSQQHAQRKQQLQQQPQRTLQQQQEKEQRTQQQHQPQQHHQQTPPLETALGETQTDSAEYKVPMYVSVIGLESTPSPVGGLSDGRVNDEEVQRGTEAGEKLDSAAASRTPPRLDINADISAVREEQQRRRMAAAARLPDAHMGRAAAAAAAGGEGALTGKSQISTVVLTPVIASVSKKEESELTGRSS